MTTFALVGRLVMLAFFIALTFLDWKVGQNLRGVIDAQSKIMDVQKQTIDALQRTIAAHERSIDALQQTIAAHERSIDAERRTIHEVERQRDLYKEAREAATNGH
jgi:septal ring factor EnvC (AmiA/AmiB activator)